jgi:hypothetical protein
MTDAIKLETICSRAGAAAEGGASTGSPGRVSILESADCDPVVRPFATGRVARLVSTPPEHIAAITKGSISPVIVLAAREGKRRIESGTSG